MAINSPNVNSILDADVENFFGAVDRTWMVRFLEHRIPGSSPRTDKRIIRLIRKWMRAGVVEDGIVTVDDRGTGQGAVISEFVNVSNLCLNAL